MENERIVDNMTADAMESPKSPIRPPRDPKPHEIAEFSTKSELYKTAKTVIEQSSYLVGRTIKVTTKEKRAVYISLPSFVGEELGTGSCNAVYSINPASALYAALNDASGGLPDQLVIRCRTNYRTFADDNAIIQTMFAQPSDTGARKLLPPMFTPYIKTKSGIYCMLVSRCHGVNRMEHLIVNRIVTEEAVLTALDHFAFYVHTNMFLTNSKGHRAGVYIPDMKPDNLGFCVYLEGGKPTVQLVCSDVEMVIPCNYDNVPWLQPAFVNSWTTFGSKNPKYVFDAIPNNTQTLTKDRSPDFWAPFQNKPRLTTNYNTIMLKMLFYVLPHMTCGLTLATLVYMYARILPQNTKTAAQNHDINKLDRAARAYFMMNTTKDMTVQPGVRGKRHQELISLFQQYQALNQTLRLQEAPNMVLLKKQFDAINNFFPVVSKYMLASFADVSA